MAYDNNIRAISRGIQVLKAINHYGSLTMMEIATLCDLPYPTACRIVETLQDECLIEREGTRKTYRPTSLVKTLSTGYHGEDELTGVARPHIVKLTRDLRWPICVSTRVGMHMMVQDSTNSTALHTISACDRGFTIPLLGSSSGKVCLAFGEDQDREQVLRLLEDTKAAGSQRVVDRLREEFKTIRNSGYGIENRIRHASRPGERAAISIPILAENTCKGILTLAFFSSAMSLDNAVERYLPKLRHTAETISRALAVVSVQAA